MSTAAVLDMDMGNTRIKWRLGNAASAGSCRYGDDWQALIAPGQRALARVRIASVAGAERTDQVRAYCRRRWQLEPELAACARRCLGVVHGYRQPHTMGVDRWLALLAGYHRRRRACLIVDCGSAVTIDIVDNDGLHRGGYIVPGMHLMRRALFRDTDAVKVVDSDLTLQVDPGDNTADAVNRGALLMVVGFVAEVHRRQLAQLGGLLDVLVSGGDGAGVSALLPLDNALCPDLVLDGLALALP